MAATTAMDPRGELAAPPVLVTHTEETSRVSWGAIFVGAVVAITFGMMMNVLGIAIGASSVDAVARDTPDASTFSIGAAVWMAISGAVGLVLGGIIAARLAASWSRKDALLHGMGVWGVSFLLAIALVGSALSGGTVAALRGASGAVTTLAAGAAATGVAGAATAASLIGPQQIVEAMQQRLSAPADPATATPEQLASEMATLMAQRIADGEWSQQDRARMEQLVAASAGIDPEVARERINEVERMIAARAAQAEEAARKAANAVATSAALISFWAFATMLAGLGAAVAGAYMGARR